MRRPPWAKVWASWYTSESHAELGPVALNIGPWLILAAKRAEVQGLLVGPTGQALPVAVISRATRFSDQEVLVALDELVSCGTLARRGDGALLFPNFARWQVTPEAERQKAYRDRVKNGQAESWVYFIRAGDAGPIKIGYTANIGKRLADLQTDHAESLQVLAHLPGGKVEEASVYDELKQSRIGRTEWFHPSEDVLRYVTRYVRVDVTRNASVTLPSLTLSDLDPDLPDRARARASSPGTVIDPEVLPPEPPPPVASDAQAAVRGAVDGPVVLRGRSVARAGLGASRPLSSDLDADSFRRVEAVIGVYRQWHPRAFPRMPLATSPEVSCILDRLAEGHSVADLAKAIDAGHSRSRWHAGANPSGQTFVRLTTLLASSSVVAELIELADTPEAEIQERRRNAKRPAGRPANTIDDTIARSLDPDRAEVSDALPGYAYRR